MAMHVLLRPRLEWGAGVWRPVNSKMGKIESTQAAILKTAFHCPSKTSNWALLQELGLRPMTAWFDMRMLEMWHRIQRMDDDRLPKQVMLAMSKRRRGGRKQLWLDLVTQVMQAWQIDAATAADMSYTAFKAEVKQKMIAAQQAALEKAERGSTTLEHYKKQYGGEGLQFSRPQQYLCGGACGRGRELVMQLRAGSLPLACLTGKFGRQRRDNPDDPVAFCCPACAQSKETADHFMLECPKYAAERSDLMAQLEESVSAEAWAAFTAVPVEERTCAIVDFDNRYKCDVISSVVAPFMIRCWKIRNECVTSNSALLGRVAHGSDAEAE
jgi:hypothetical protein